MLTITGMPNNLLITGKSGIGKSTVLAKVAELLEPRVISGFLSPRNQDGLTAQGWKIVGFSGVTGIVAHPDIEGHRRMGSLGVDMELFDRCVGSENGTLSESDLVIIDEIGIFSDWSDIFRNYVIRAMNADVPVVAIVRQKQGEFSDQIKRRTDVEIWTTTEQNSDSMHGDIANWIEGLDAFRGP